MGTISLAIVLSALPCQPSLQQSLTNIEHNMQECPKIGRCPSIQQCIGHTMIKVLLYLLKFKRTDQHYASTPVKGRSVCLLSLISYSVLAECLYLSPYLVSRTLSNTKRNPYLSILRFGNIDQDFRSWKDNIE